MTSGCTAQACNLRDNYQELKNAGYEVIGVSINDQKSHLKFIEKNALPFTLIADTEQKLVQEFEYGEKKHVRTQVHGYFPYHLHHQRGRNHRAYHPAEGNQDQGSRCTNSEITHPTGCLYIYHNILKH